MSPPKILDTHIHLWPSTSTTSAAHAWMKPNHILSKRHGISDYQKVVDESVQGFIYVETDRHVPIPAPDFQTSDDDDDMKSKLRTWAHQPIEELKFLRRIAEQKTEEGDASHDNALMKGCVIWAPVHMPSNVFRLYISLAEEIAGPTLWSKVVGFRYLLQGKSSAEIQAVVASDAWLENMAFLYKGRHGAGWAFDIGVDVNRDGEEGFLAVGEMISQTRRRGINVRFVLNHLCKHPLPAPNPSQAWISTLQTFKHDENISMKLSGAFNEFASTPSNVSDIVLALRPCLDVVFDCFPARVMFASDWPVCNVGGPRGEDENWGVWKQVVEGVMDARQFTEREREGIWWRNGCRVYGIEM